MDSTEFVEAVTQHGLADAGKLWQFLANQGGAKGLPMDPAQLAEQFVAAGLLTTLQASRVLEGEAASLTVGPYQLLERLGGEAYLARQRRGKGLAVVKPAHRGHPPRMPGIPNLVQAHGLDGTDWLMMDRAEGQSLDHMGTLSPVQAARAVLSVATALAALHASGLVHGRVRPEHIIGTTSGDAVLLHPAASPLGTEQQDLRGLARVLEAVAEQPPALEALREKMHGGQFSAAEVVELLTEWLAVVAPPPLIVPNRRSSASNLPRPSVDEDVVVTEGEEGKEWLPWALTAGATGALGLAALMWFYSRT